MGKCNRYIIRIDGKLLEIEKKTIFLDEKNHDENFSIFACRKMMTNKCVFILNFFYPNINIFIQNCLFHS